MNNWPKQYQTALVAFLILILSFSTLYFILIKPLQNKVNDDNKYIEELKTKLLKSNWPLDPGRLASILQLKKSELNIFIDKSNATSGHGLKNVTDKSIKYATKYLNEKLKKTFDSPSDFIRDASRLDFQEEFNQLEQKLASRSIFLSDQILNLNQQNPSKEIYKLLLQVWTLDKISSIVLSSGLQFQMQTNITAQDETGRTKPAAKIQFNNIIDYRLSPDSNSTYLLEIPLKISLHGTSSSFYKFLNSMQNEENFFPIKKIQILSLPELINSETELSIKTGYLLIEIECSAFFSPHDTGSPRMPQNQQQKIIPAGA